MVALFERDPLKDDENRHKHGVSFSEAQLAFLDPHRLIASDLKHRLKEQRFFCFGKIGDGVMTVRFVIQRIYEAQDRIHG